MASAKSLLKTLVVGLCAGFISGLFGLGGGIIFVPAMIYLLKIPQHTAQGTALLVILPTAISGAIQYYVAGYVNLTYVVWIAAGAMLGVLLGSFIAHKTHPDRLKILFGSILIITAIKMFIG